MIWRVSRTPCMRNLTWWFLTRYLDDGVILHVMNHNDMSSWLVYRISALSHDYKFIENPMSLKSILGGYWWFLTWDLEDGVILGIMDCHAMWFLTCVPNFNTTYIMIRCVSGTPHPWSQYLQDRDGSWLGTWRMGSSLTSWIIVTYYSRLVYQISAL